MEIKEITREDVMVVHDGQANAPLIEKLKNIKNYLNIIYNDVNESQATYKYLYSYNKNDTEVHIEDITAIGLHALDSVSNYNLYVNSDNLSELNSLSFVNCPPSTDTVCLY